VQDAQNPGIRRVAPQAMLGEPTDGDQNLRSEHVECSDQKPVAGRIKGLSFFGREFVGGAVAAAGFHEHERTVIQNEVVGEKRLGRAEAITHQAPETPTADLGALAVEAGDRPLRVFGVGPADRTIDAEPVPHQADFPERHADLRHAPGARIHAEKHDPLSPASELPQVLFMSLARVDQRVVDISRRFTEVQAVDFFSERARRVQQRPAHRLDVPTGTIECRRP